MASFISKAGNFIKNRVKTHWRLDRKGSVFFICIVIFFALGYWFNNVMANLASQRSRKVFEALGFRYVLPDIGFNIFPHTTLLWYTDFTVYMMIGLAVLNLLFYPRPWRFLSRFLLSWGVALILRITTVATTSVPDPRLDCEFVTGNVFSAVALHRCGDAVYSGHTIVYATCFLTYASFAPSNWAGRIAKLVAFGFALAGSIMIITNRAHYTIDVLLAWYICIGAWYSVAYIWFWQITKKGRLLMLEFPFGVGQKAPGESNHVVKKRLLMLGLDSNGNKVDYSSFVPDDLPSHSSPKSEYTANHEQPDHSSQTIDISR